MKLIVGRVPHALDMFSSFRNHRLRAVPFSLRNILSEKQDTQANMKISWRAGMWKLDETSLHYVCECQSIRQYAHSLSGVNLSRLFQIICVFDVINDFDSMV